MAPRRPDQDRGAGRQPDGGHQGRPGPDDPAAGDSMRTALVTGATSGIGRAAALALGDAGWWVLACGRDPQRGAEVAAELTGRAGGEVSPRDPADDRAP